MRPYERASTLLTSNRQLMIGESYSATPLRSRHCWIGCCITHVLKCGPRSWRTKVQTDLHAGQMEKRNFRGEATERSPCKRRPPPRRTPNDNWRRLSANSAPSISALGYLCGNLRRAMDVTALPGNRVRHRSRYPSNAKVAGSALKMSLKTPQRVATSIGRPAQLRIRRKCRDRMSRHFALTRARQTQHCP